MNSPQKDWLHTIQHLFLYSIRKFCTKKAWIHNISPSTHPSLSSWSSSTAVKYVKFWDLIQRVGQFIISVLENRRGHITVCKRENLSPKIAPSIPAPSDISRHTQNPLLVFASSATSHRLVTHDLASSGITSKLLIKPDALSVFNHYQWKLLKSGWFAATCLGCSETWLLMQSCTRSLWDAW